MKANPAFEFALDIAERISARVPARVTRFFGGAALVVDGVQFAFIMQGSLYLRVDDTSRAAYEAIGAAPFVYAGRFKRVKVASYYEAPSEVLDDDDALTHWAAEAWRAACAAKVSKRKRGAVPSGKRSLKKKSV